MTTLDVLRTARALIDTPDKWSQAAGWGHSGRHCAGGAIMAAAGLPYDHRALCGPGRAAVVAVARVIGSGDSPAPSGALALWNDSHSHTEVLAAIDRAIAAEHAREQEFSVTPLEPLPREHSVAS